MFAFEARSKGDWQLRCDIFRGRDVISLLQEELK